MSPLHHRKRGGESASRDVTASTGPARVQAPCYGVMKMHALLSGLLALLPLQIAHATTRVEVLETFPADTQVRLPSGQNYYLRLQYDTDSSTRIWARPYLRGKPARAGSNPSFSYPAGRGEALGWFFLMEPGDAVDEIRITGGDGSPGGTRTLLSIPVDIVGTRADDASPPEEADWVVQMRADEVERRTSEMQQAARESSGGNGIVYAFMGVMLLLLVAGVAWPIRALRRWRGGWRLAALAPLVAMGFVVLRIVVGVSRDPTSHNLWPFEIIYVAFTSIAAMTVLGLMRRFRGVR